MKKALYISLLPLFFALSVSAQMDSTLKFHNSNIDSVRMKYKDHIVFKRNLYYETGVRKEKLRKHWRGLNRAVTVKYDERGKRISKTIFKYRRGCGREILITWVWIFPKRKTMTIARY